jgi:LuxR family transcriptional regulator, maltose regulon positive regulatory protein
MQKADTLIRTKLHLPFTRRGLVSRPRLQEQITQGLRGPLTLITAPAGFGKTILVASCVAGCGMPVAWLSLDKDDNQGERFLNYLVAALQEADRAIGEEAAQLMEGMQPAPPKAVLTSLINDVDTTGREIVLVLDDYHLIASQAVQEAVVFLLEHCPKTFHLVIATRSDPPLPLARLRARGQTVELRAADLRFTALEAAQFLNGVMGLRLEAGSVAVLEERTEGWIAGLQMAAVSMRDREDTLGFIEGFSGTHRYILDYLLEEVLTGQPPEVQRFLLCTSILERLTAPLCDAVLAGDAGAKGESVFVGSSASMLEYLEQANLFLVPLDDERTWYRYHNLFADLLRARLHQAQPDFVPLLHIRASAWLEQRGFITAAIHHLIVAQENGQAADLIEHYGPVRWAESDLSVAQMAEYLPPEMLRIRPKLGIYQAWILISQGRTPAAIPLLHDLKGHLSASGIDPSCVWMRSCVDLLLAYISTPAVDQVQFPFPDYPALESMPKEETGLRNTADFLYAMLLCRLGELDRPAEILLYSVRRDTALQGTTAIPMAIPILARIRLMQGRLHEAADLCREYLKPIVNRGTKFFYMSGSLNIILGEVLREWNDLEGAEAQIRTGIQANEPWNNTASDAYGYSALARVQEAMGNVEGAFLTQHKLDEIFEGRTRPPDWENEQRSLKVRIWLAKGDLASAVEWADHFSLSKAPGPPDETDQLTLARVRLAQKKYTDAQHILEALDRVPGIDKRVNRKLKIGILLACVLAGQNRFSQAMPVLESCLAMAEPEGHIRVFLDAGKLARDLLYAYLQTSPAIHQDYARKLLDAFLPSRGAGSPGLQPAGLIEPLTRRELEVLNLMALGRTNQEIARQLIVAPGTIKAHTASIYRKLDVANRTEAVARARQLCILP